MRTWVVGVHVCSRVGCGSGDERGSARVRSRVEVVVVVVVVAQAAYPSDDVLLDVRR